MNRPSFSRYGLPIIAVLGLLFTIWVIWSGRPDRSLTDPAEQPPTAPAGRAVVSGAGIVEPSSELVQLSPLVPGVVSRVLVSPGDRVAKGQLILALDDREARAALAEAEAAEDLAEEQLAAARVDLANARAQLGLVLGVSDPAAVSEQQRLDRRQAVAAAAARVDVAEADLARARAAIASARTEIGRRELRAPTPGEILQVRTRAGQYVTAGPGPSNSDPPVTMGETRPLHVRIDIDETEIGRVQMGAPAEVSARGAATRPVTAAFVRMEPLVVPKRSLTNQAAERVDVRVLQLIYALPGDAGGFAVGQQVDAFLPARQAGQQAR